MTERERFLGWMTRGRADRPPYWLIWGPWHTTWRRWQSEGMPAQFRDYGDVRRHFGADAGVCYLPVDVGPCPEFEHRILEETDEFRTAIDSWGIKRRDFKGHVSMSQFLEFPVKSRADWQRYKAQRLNPADPRRLAGPWRREARKAAEDGRPVQFGGYPDLTTYGAVRWLLGDEECLLAYYDEPELVHDIMDTMMDVALAVLGRVADEGVRVDVIHFWEDFCGRQGPLIGPAHVEEFMAPCYRRMRDFADAHGIPLLSVDTDGWPDPIVGPLMRAGMNYLYPFEVAAGCDVNDFRRRYPTLAMMGGIDKRALAAGPDAIDAELERIRPAVASGRYIPDLDHLVPDDVSWVNFCYYAERLAELVGKKK